jgi:hypothetical protein
MTIQVTIMDDRGFILAYQNFAYADKEKMTEFIFSKYQESATHTIEIKKWPYVIR